MAKGARGFRKLRNSFVVSVNDRACNVVYLTLADGKRYAIEAETNFLGIPILSLKEEPKKNAKSC